MNEPWIPLQNLKTPILQKNLAYLQSRQHELLNWLPPSSSGETLLIQKCDAGILCKVQSASWIIGENNLPDEIERICQRIRNLSIVRGLLVMVGGSAGYGVAAVIPYLLRNPELHVLIVEPSRERIFAALMFCDLFAGLRSERLHFLVSELDEKRIVERMEPFHLVDLDPVAVYAGPELEGCVDENRFRRFFHELAEKYQKRLDGLLETFRKRERSGRTIRRVLFVNCWANAPGDIHIRCIAQFLQERKIECRNLFLNRHRFDAAGLEYRRFAEPQILQALSSFQPDLILSFGYHAPQFITPRIFETFNAAWVQMVSNIAYYDEDQYPGEISLVAEERMIPIFQRRGYGRMFFLPLMANYVQNTPVETNQQFPLVILGNSFYLLPAQVQPMMESWRGRKRLLNYLERAVHDLGQFDAHVNFYDYLEQNPVPEVNGTQEWYQVFRYLLCQASTVRRVQILEKLAPLGLHIFGSNWENSVSPDSPIRGCLRGYFPMAEEKKIFSQGTIFINTHTIGNDTGPNMRFFNTSGMGAFQITDQKQFGRYLEPGREAVYAGSVDDYVEKVRFYLAHPEERDRIRTNAQQRVLRDWTYRNWLDRVLAIVTEEKGE